jgi:hypothetical protein
MVIEDFENFSFKQHIHVHVLNISVICPFCEKGHASASHFGMTGKN